MRYRRIVAKFGTSLLTAGSKRLDLEAMSRLVGQVVRLRAQGAQVVVVSSGAQAAGRHRMANRIRPGATLSRQAIASVGQSHLMQSWDELFDWHDTVVAQVLLTRRDLSDRLGYLNARNTLRDLLEAGAVPIVNENDAVALDQVLATRIGENDSLSAYVANLVDADLLAILTDVDGLYDGDPSVNPEAKRIERVERIDSTIEALAGGARGPGTGGMLTKLTAARIATQGGVDVVIANGRKAEVLVDIANGHERGTIFPHAGDRLESRKRWILGNIARTGQIVVDAGAVEALREHGRSLLPAGVAAVEGQFDRGETVEIRDAEGQPVAVGTTNYGAAEIVRILRLHSDRIAETLGYSYGDEVVHRDNLVLL
ncbi:MAG: glutamate 5-kinase [Dehalococcoidia bacterium]|nr:glutamate 5-kinase [Dehalococcoidia bacterium]